MLLVLLLPLTGCDSLARAFGFVRNSPDEFTVTTQAPLTMPPSNALPPPTPGAGRPGAVSARTGALEAIAPGVALGGGSGGGPSAGQAALLDQADARAAAPARSGEITGGGGGIAGDLAFWKRRPAAITIDAPAEQRRLQNAAANGEGPDSGPTPATAGP